MNVKEKYRKLPVYTLLDGEWIGIGGKAKKGDKDIPEATPEQYQKLKDQGFPCFSEQSSEVFSNYNL